MGREVSVILSRRVVSKWTETTYRTWVLLSRLSQVVRGAKWCNVPLADIITSTELLFKWLKINAIWDVCAENGVLQQREEFVEA